jgi:hypothetical protein
VPRPAAGNRVMLRPASTMSPSLAVSWPAIMRSVDDLPQPDGPSRQQYFPLATFTSIEFTATEVS